MMLKNIIFLIITVIFVSTVYADNIGGFMNKKGEEFFNELISGKEPDYKYLFTAKGKKTSGKVKTEDITSYRWQNTSNLELGGAHVTIVLNSRNELSGFARMTSNTIFKTLPNKEETEKIGVVFLEKYAPDLIPVMDLQWIDTHDETITVNGKKEKITGIKMKCRNKADGTYFWVILDGDGSVIVFERDIEWDFLKAGRQTEKWLHDDWIKSKKIEYIKAFE